MPNDDETGDWRDSLGVPEGSRISLEELENEMAYAGESKETFYVDSNGSLRARVISERENRPTSTPTEPTPTDGLPPNLQTIYPKLSIIEEADPQHPEHGTGDIGFDFFVYLTTFQESFKARWQKGERSYGRLNPMYYYGGTNRTVDISFALPAGTVRESRQNLNNCSQLSRAIYGRYRKWNILASEGFGAADVYDFTLVGSRYFRVNLGSLLRNERVFISGFTFTVNQDAGVFDYDGSVVGSDGNPIDTDVTHSTKGLLLPKQIDVVMNMIFKHDYLLGFEGPNRLTDADKNKWASNTGKDWPHGTGDRAVAPYMTGDGTIAVVRTEEDGVPEGDD
tara:strand:- start:2172 stop:3182 length:1011 start_codon:yes stop_codon:yes gene_type:complete